MIETGKQHYLLFDGDCGVCSALSDVAVKMDRRGKYIIKPYFEFPEDELKKFGITYADCSRGIQVVSRTGHVYRAAFGLNHFLFNQFPWTIAAALIYALPILLLLEIIGYRLVAWNRARISIWLGLTVCKVRPSKPKSVPPQAQSQSQSQSKESL